MDILEPARLLVIEMVVPADIRVEIIMPVLDHHLAQQARPCVQFTRGGGAQQERVGTRIPEKEAQLRGLGVGV